MYFVLGVSDWKLGDLIYILKCLSKRLLTVRCVNNENLSNNYF